MGERRVPECDIFGTLQPNGLRTIHVKVWQDGQTPEAIDTVLADTTLEVSERGRQRVFRMIEQACSPPKKREAKAGKEM